MQVIPAIDLLGADAVRLERGSYERVIIRRPALEYVRALVAGRPPLLHLVDLDGARSGQIRLDALSPILAAAGIPVQVSGGIRSVAAAEGVLAQGAARVVVGTAAFGERALLDALSQALGDRLVVAIDVRGGLVAVSGWLNQTAITVGEALARCRDAGVSRVLGTAIDRDGTMTGPDLDLIAELCASGLSVLAAGGIRGDGDLADLERLGCEGAIIGRAIAEATPIEASREVSAE
jgi:phosphoribosylformimino-5-aminoimidazole carboxamide ribotide isomerase